MRRTGVVILIAIVWLAVGAMAILGLIQLFHGGNP